MARCDLPVPVPPISTALRILGMIQKIVRWVANQRDRYPVEARCVRVVSPCLRPGLYRHCTVLLPAAVARNDVNQIFDQDCGKASEEEQRTRYRAARQQHGIEPAIAIQATSARVNLASATNSPRVSRPIVLRVCIEITPQLGTTAAAARQRCRIICSPSSAVAANPAMRPRIA